MNRIEWWQRGPIEDVPELLQPVAHILLEVRDSVIELTRDLSLDGWNERPAGVASPAFHVRHIAGVIDRLFTYARGELLSPEQFDQLARETSEMHTAEIATAIDDVHTRVVAALAELVKMNPATLTDYRAVGRAGLPSTVIGCLMHGAEHAMRHVGQLSVTVRVLGSIANGGPTRTS